MVVTILSRTMQGSPAEIYHLSKDPGGRWQKAMLSLREQGGSGLKGTAGEQTQR